jgi:type VI secretion system protein VasG
VVKIEEPDEAAAVRMLRGVASVLEAHHKVQLLDEAIEAAVTLSHRYIPARQLPDKAVSLLDTACARVAVSQHATPAEVEDLLRRRQSLEVEAAIIGREAAIGIDTAERSERVEAELAEVATALEAAEARWQREKELVREILDLRARLRGEGVSPDTGEADTGEATRARPMPRPRAPRRITPNRTPTPERHPKQRRNPRPRSSPNPTPRPTSPACANSWPSSPRPRARPR